MSVNFNTKKSEAAEDSRKCVKPNNGGCCGETTAIYK